MKHTTQNKKHSHVIQSIIVLVFFLTILGFIIVSTVFTTNSFFSSLQGEIRSTLLFSTNALLVLGVILFFAMLLVMRKSQIDRTGKNYQTADPEARKDYERNLTFKSIWQTKKTLKEFPFPEKKTQQYHKRYQYLIVQSILHAAFITKDAIFWTLKLFIPNPLISYPSLWDNLKSLAKEKQFQPIRMLVYSWLIFAIIISGTTVYFLKVGQAEESMFTVDSTEDASDVIPGNGQCRTDGLPRCTLRAAIQEANAFLGTDTINFNIGGGGPKTIQPGSALPQITQTVTIDGTTQPGYLDTPLIEIDGASTLPLSVNALEITSGSYNTTIKGLVINNFTASGDKGIYISANNVVVQGNIIGTDTSNTPLIGMDVGIQLSGSDCIIGGTTAAERNIISGNTNGLRLSLGMPDGNTIQGNYIGTTIDGTAALANSGDGIVVGPTTMITDPITIGGTAPGARNVISGNRGSGIEFATNFYKQTVIQGNYIGTDASGTGDLGNGDDGITISFTDGDITIGGTAPGAANIIAFNDRNGIRISNSNSVDNGFFSNSIYSNDGIGIDLNGDGKTLNDIGDGDFGSNNFQNFPVVTLATPTGTNFADAKIEGTLNSANSTTYAVQFFSNTSCDGTGNGEGETYLGETTTATDGLGNATFSTTIPSTSITGSQSISATAIDPSDNTSEFSACGSVTDLNYAVIMEVDDSTPAEGDTAIFTTTITNNGASTATNAALIAAIPSGLTYVSNTPSQGSYIVGTGVWAIGSLANGASATLALTTTVDAGQEGNTISPTTSALTADQGDSDTSDNTGTASVLISATDADLQVGTSVTNATPAEGSSTTFTITLTNNGTSNATNVSITAAVPAGLTYVSNTPSQGSYVSGTGVWTVGNINNGNTTTLTIIATANSGTAGTTRTLTTSNLTADQGDSDTSNNASSVSVTPTAAPAPPPSGSINLSVNITADNTTPSIGDRVTSTATVSNSGTISSTNTSLTIKISSGLTLISATPSQGTWTEGSVIWSVGTITAGSSANIAVVTQVNENATPGNISITAQGLTSDQTDSDESDNTDTVVIEIPEEDPTPEPPPPQVQTTPRIIVAAGPQGSPQVKGFSPGGTFDEDINFNAYDSKYRGGIYIATGDIDKDQKDEIITGSGDGGTPHIRVFERMGTQKPIQLFPFHPDHKGGATVASGDTDGDGKAEIGTCQAKQAQAWCKVYRYNQEQTIIAEWNAFGDVESGASIAFGDVDNDGRDEAIISPGPDGGPQIKVYDITDDPIQGPNQGIIQKAIQFSAFHSENRSGLSLASADTDNDGKAEITACQKTGDEAFCKVYRYNQEKTVLGEWRAYPQGVESGAFVTMGDIDNDNYAEIITGPDKGGSPQISIFNRDGTRKATTFDAYTNLFRGGVRPAFGEF